VVRSKKLIIRESPIFPYKENTRIMRTQHKGLWTIKWLRPYCLVVFQGATLIFHWKPSHSDSNELSVTNKHVGRKWKVWLQTLLQDVRRNKRKLRKTHWRTTSKKGSKPIITALGNKALGEAETSVCTCSWRTMKVADGRLANTPVSSTEATAFRIPVQISVRRPPIFTITLSYFLTTSPPIP
jgi:hypothetical protein